MKEVVMTGKRKKFFSSVVALASVLILVGVGLARADVSNKIVWQQDQVLGGGNWDLYLMNNNGSGKAVKADMGANTQEIEPSASYDGSKVVYAKSNSGFGESAGYDIYTRLNDTGDSRLLTDGRQPCIGPCNDKIAFSRYSSGKWNIYTANADGGGVSAAPLGFAGKNNEWPFISPDGTKIIFASDNLGANNWEIYEMDLNGNGKTNLSNSLGNDIDPAYNAAGNKIVFVSNRVGSQNDIYTMNADGTSQTRVTAESSFEEYPGFSLYDGNTIVFTSNYENGNNFGYAGEIYTVSATAVSSTRWAWNQLTNNTYYDKYATWGGAQQDLDPPTNLVGITSCVDCSNTTIQLAWTDNANNEDSFSIWKRAGTTGAWSVDTALANATSKCLSGLTLDTLYQIRVSADNECGPGNKSDTLTIPTKPAPPTNFKAVVPLANSNGWRQIDLSWFDISNINDGYYIQRYIVKSTTSNNPVETCPCNTCDTATNYIPNGAVIKLVGSTATTYPDSIGLSPKTCYYYKIKAYVGYDSDGNGSKDAEATCHWVDSSCTNTTDTNPLAPTMGTVILGDTDELQITFTDNSGAYYYQQEDGFRLYRGNGTNTSAISIPANPGTGVVNLTDTGLTPGTKYCYQVSAYNVISEDTSTAIVCATTCDTAPTKPTNLQCTETSSTSIDLSFIDNSNNEDRWLIEISTNNGTTWTTRSDSGTSNSGGVGGPVMASLTSLTPGTDFQLRVRARTNNVCGGTLESDASNTTTQSTNVSKLWIEGPLSNGASECGNDSDPIGEDSMFEIKVMIDYVNNLDTVKFDLTYDTNVLDSNPSLVLGDLTAGCVLTQADTPTAKGRMVSVVIQVPGLNGVDCFSGSCSLLKVVFKTADAAVIDSETFIGLGETPGVIDSQLGDITPKFITVLSECGDTLHVVKSTLGDANCDGKVNILDITVMEQILVGVRMACSLYNLNTNGVNNFDPADIICLEKMLIGLPCNTPAPAQFSEVATGTIRELAFRVDGVTDLDVAYLDVRYGEGIQITGVTAGELTEGATPYFNIEDGRVRMILNMAGLTGVSGSGTIFKVSFVGDGEFSINQAALGSVDATLISVPVEMITPPGINAIPTRTKLYQNFPNPLNPETLIPFDLAAEANVAINIYTLSGQLVRTLDMGKLEAGVYVKQGEAAFWDGKNSAGVEVSSGVYLYQIKAGDFTSTRKLIVLK